MYSRKTKYSNQKYQNILVLKQVADFVNRNFLKKELGTMIFSNKSHQMQSQKYIRVQPVQERLRVEKDNANFEIATLCE